MKLALSLSLLLTCIEIIDYVVAEDEMTFDITSMVGSEDLYLQLKRRYPSLKHPREEKLRHKEDICLAILADEFFDVHKVEMVNPNYKTIYKQVKQHHPDIHNEHFKLGFSSEVIKPKFANLYRPRDVNVRGNIIREYVFTCLAKNCTTKNIQQYFVSPEYNVYDSSTKIVRFVFAYNNKKEMVVMAKAEKKSHSQKTVTTSRATSVKPTEQPSEESSYEEDEDESESW